MLIISQCPLIVISFFFALNWGLDWRLFTWNMNWGLVPLHLHVDLDLGLYFGLVLLHLVLDLLVSTWDLIWNSFVLGHDLNLWILTWDLIWDLT